MQFGFILEKMAMVTGNEPLCVFLKFVFVGVICVVNSDEVHR
jgi:hypothetical protein